ncbi:hypothetical protein SAMN04515695_4780 [Pseudovibrio sp. Tun.PSC04-5.I4]|nr:hypothetical protein SAMN04515695_4780 [Pseudovibrio sp. Tun.PSC04-5.I4]
MFLACTLLSASRIKRGKTVEGPCFLFCFILEQTSNTGAVRVRCLIGPGSKAGMTPCVLHYLASPVSSRAKQRADPGPRAKSNGTGARSPRSRIKCGKTADRGSDMHCRSPYQRHVGGCAMHTPLSPARGTCWMRGIATTSGKLRIVFVVIHA